MKDSQTVATRLSRSTVEWLDQEAKRQRMATGANVQRSTVIKQAVERMKAQQKEGSK